MKPTHDCAYWYGEDLCHVLVTQILLKAQKQDVSESTRQTLERGGQDLEKGFIAIVIRFRFRKIMAVFLPRYLALPSTKFRGDFIAQNGNEPSAGGFRLLKLPALFKGFEKGPVRYFLCQILVMCPGNRHSVEGIQVVVDEKFSTKSLYRNNNSFWRCERHKRP